MIFPTMYGWVRRRLQLYNGNRRWSDYGAPGEYPYICTIYPERDFGFAPNTFAVLTTSPQVAQAYLPTLTYLGQR